MKNRNTIVSAFMSNINSRSDRNYEKYLLFAKSLLIAPVNKIIFVDKTVLHDFANFANENTTIIPFDKNANYLYQHKEVLTPSEEVLHTSAPGKDTTEYIFTMTYKTEFVRKAVYLDNYGSSDFTWIDIGIKHMMQNLTDEEFSAKLLRLQNIEYPGNVRIASIWDPDYTYYTCDLYKDISWYFAGSIFGGNKRSLLEFADLTKTEALRIMEEKKYLMWEVNIWKLVYNIDRWRFLYYIVTDHNSELLDLY
jgi:hypothetical protein